MQLSTNGASQAANMSKTVSMKITKTDGFERIAHRYLERKREPLEFERNRRDEVSTMAYRTSNEEFLAEFPHCINCSLL